MEQCFFVQAEDGIRDYKVTGVQTCALPICQPFTAPLTSLASISLRYIHAIAPSIGSGSSPSRISRSRNFRAFFGWRDASMSANSQTVVVFSDRKSVV